MAGHGVDKVDGDDRLERRRFLQRVEGLGLPVEHDGHARAVVQELFLQLVGGVERVVLDGDGADAQDRGDGDDVLRAVRQRDDNAVAWCDAEVLQGGSEAVDLLVEGLVGECFAHEPGGCAARVGGCGGIEQADEGVAADDRVRVGPFGVVRKPGFGFVGSHKHSFC